MALSSDGAQEGVLEIRSGSSSDLNQLKWSSNEGVMALRRRVVGQLKFGEDFSRYLAYQGDVFKEA